MMKFFRKYMRQMLAVFVSLLLVVWLGGSALQNILRPDPSAETVGYAFKSDVKLRDIQRATSETQILRSLGLPWFRPWMMMRSGQMVQSRDLEALDWYLLQQESARQGVPVTKTEVINFLNSVDKHGTLRQQLQRRMNVSMAAIEASVADHLRIVKLGQMVSTSRKVSAPELKRAIADFQERVEVRLVALSAGRFTDEAGEASDADLEKHFQAYRNVAKGEGKYGFGYRFPQRVQVEYIEVDTDKVAQDVRISSLQARRFWRENKELPIFRRPTSASTQPASTQPTSTPAASQAATQPKPQFFKTFAEAEEAAVKHLKNKRAKDEATSLLNRILSQLRVDFASGKRLESDYRAAPEPVRAANYYSVILDRFKQQPHGSALALHTSGKLLTSEQLTGLPGIGRAQVMGGSDKVPPSFLDVAFQVQGLTDIPDGDDVNRSHYTSLYQTFISPLRGTDGNFYIFRVVKVEKPRPAESLAEVADAVKEDVKVLRSHEVAHKAAERLEKEAKEVGLEQAWADEETLKQKVGPLDGYQTPPPFGRRGAGVPGLGGEDKFTEACFQLAVSNPVTQADKVKLIELPRAKKWVVVELVKFYPMVKERYEAIKSFMLQSLAMQKQGEVLGDWFGSATIRTRTGFHSAAKEKKSKKRQKNNSRANAATASEG